MIEYMSDNPDYQEDMRVIREAKDNKGVYAQSIRLIKALKRPTIETIAENCEDSGKDLSRIWKDCRDLDRIKPPSHPFHLT